MKELTSYIKETMINPILFALGFKKKTIKEKEYEFKDVNKYIENMKEVEKYILEHCGLKRYSLTDENKIIPKNRYSACDAFNIRDDYERNQRVTEYVMERDKVTEYVMTRDRDNRTMHQILSDFENKRPIKEIKDESI